MQFSLGFRLRCGAFLRRLLLRLGELAFFLSLLSLFLSVPFRYSPLQGQCLFYGVLLGFLRLQPFFLQLVGARLFQAVVLPGSGFCRCLMLAACRLCRGRRSCRNACFWVALMFFLVVCPCASVSVALRVTLPLTSASISRLCDTVTLPLPAWFCCRCCVKVWAFADTMTLMIDKKRKTNLFINKMRFVMVKRKEISAMLLLFQNNAIMPMMPSWRLSLPAAPSVGLS